MLAVAASKIPSSELQPSQADLLMYYTSYPATGQTMSALESPPSLAASWSEPWAMSAAAAAGVMDPHDFYKSTFSASPPMMGIAAAVTSSEHNTSGSTHGSSSGGGVAGDTVSTSSRKRVVNFKLDIKPEPEDACVPQMQKVPSISDLSDPDSSIDIPTQVSPTIVTTTPHFSPLR
jgi:hypothetical protein